MKNQFVHFARVFIVTGYYLLVAFPLVVSAAVTLQWDANDPAPTGYNLFQRRDGQSYDYVTPVNTEVISGTSYIVDNLQPGVTYYFVVRAFVGSDQSGDSNEVAYAEPAVDEYDNGNDPTQETNYLPAAPELSAPANQDTVSLTPTLTTHAFSDANGDSHVETRYQIALDLNFTDLVFDRRTTQNLTSLSLIDLILDPDTTYYWRVQFVDSRDGESQWSASSSFTTVDYVEAGDLDGNGLLDSQEISDMDVDLDGDQVPDAIQTDLLCVNTGDGLNPQVSIKGGSQEIQVVALRANTSEDSGRTLSLNAPDTLTGLISFKLYLDSGVTTAFLEVYFTTPAPEDAQYYFSTEHGWVAYTDVVFSSDRKSVTITMEDGGDGDQDGVENGVIVDPAGLGYSSQTADSMSYATTEQSSCFISTPLTAGEGSTLPGPVAIVWGLGLGGAVMMVRRKRS
jgi:chitinase